MLQWKLNSAPLVRKGALVVAILLSAIFFGVSALGGCVETAECNESVRCSEGTICYEYRCRPRCDGAATCARGEICRPCMDPATEEEHCFGRQGSACLPESN
jgi:hypothetical protein